MKHKFLLKTQIALAALFLFASCGGEKNLTSSSESMLYAIPVNTISVKGVTEKNITTTAFWKIPLSADQRFFSEFDKIKSELNATQAIAYRTNDIRMFIQSGKRQLFIDKSGTMHEGESFYQMNSKANELIKSIVPDSLRSKLSYDFLVTAH